MSELNADLKDKESSLEQSQKIILKLKNEYQKIIKEYKTLEEYNNELEQKNVSIQKIHDGYTKNQLVYEKTLKQNEQLKTELEKIKKESKYYKDNYATKLNEYNKKEKEAKDKDSLINELKTSGNKFLNMIKERENLIQSCTNKINELNLQLEQKEEQLKMMVNFSKEINKENKSNVQELTKQAVKTIKIFYNTLNNNNGSNDDYNQLEIKSVPIEEKNYIEELESSLVSKKCPIHLQDAINAILFIPQNQKFISKEFLIENNFRTNLIKNEFFSSLIREFNIVQFLKDLFDKISPPKGDSNDSSSLSLEQLVNNVISFKTCFEDTMKENNELKAENNSLKSKLKEIELYIVKMKNDIKSKVKKLNEKITIADKAYQVHINTLNDELVRLKAKYKSDLEKAKNEVKLLRLDNDKINNINLNLNAALKERDDVILHLQEENTNLTNENTNLKTKLNLSTRGFQYQTDAIPNIKTASMTNNNMVIDTNNNNQITNERVDTNNNNFEQSKRSISYDYTNRKIRKSHSPFKMQTIDTFSYEIVSPPHEVINNEVHSQMGITNENIEIPNLPLSDGFNINVNQCNMCNNMNAVINELIRNVPFNRFNLLVKSYNSLPKELFSLSTRIDDVVSKLQSTTKNFTSIPQEKKIKVSQMLEILSQVEKLLTFLSSNISKSNKEMSAYSEDAKEIFGFVNDIVYDGRPISEMSNTNYNIDNNHNLISSNNTLPIITNNINVEIKQFFNINPKIFSSSELIKFYSIYENKQINEVIQIFSENCEEIKSIITKMRFDFETDTSEYDDEGALFASSRSKVNSNINEGSAYKIVNEKILSLKKFEFNFSIFMEILKNYLVAFEMLIRVLQSEDKIDKTAVGAGMNTLYSIFEDSAYYKIDEMEDDIIFNRKVIVKLLLNHKEYLFIAYDV